MEEKTRHLEMIQAVINRMAGNCFMLKGWAVTIVVGFFMLSGKDTNGIYSLIAFVPTIGFWFLDAYYLLLERMYRILFNLVRKKRNDQVDFNMDLDQISLKDKKAIYKSCLLSVTELCFYLPFTFLVAIIILSAY